ncbi:DUF6194 family protein [Micromonospora sagamiensis]|uniref:DUF6194 domain-containing protein n=1 Tax=Micromonospora sagamiensis TaxID=47875 RepID=A0A562WCI5_9ACTN|nr:DUF6194 family protein [Micromonospora sagamiensis]TWJ27983.1 hypothetical protein JD81_01486 [Micromonospora sagamiensis]BCL13128.1 hypothetical protein GCM10017556_08670 [Micromonospora sagamiensis]
MTEEDIVEFVTSLPGVDLLTASAANGAPEMAWGDHFFYYDPDRDLPADRRMPFATIVGRNYPGFDTASDLDRDGVFRVNVAVGRQVFEELFGHAPAAHGAHHDEYDHAALDRFVPHPLYATQGWASVLNPGEATAERTRALLAGAHARAVARHRPKT